MTIRVLIVEDSVLTREILRDIFDGCDDFLVVGEAENGLKAIKLATELNPDLITMDLEMPVMDGYQAIQEIMQRKAIPILVVSSVVDADKAYRAISYGAVDAIQKPSISEEEQASFVKRAQLIAKVPVIRQIRPSAYQNSVSVPACSMADEPVPYEQAKVGCKKAICIASSTGGPQALEVILKSINSRINAPVFVTQHISKGFAEGMAEWLNSVCSLQVKVPVDNESVCINTVYISPSEKNMVITDKNTIRLLNPSEQEIYHPNCNVLLESIADVYGENSVGVILSGMGCDGHKGLKKILMRGGDTIGQDEKTSVVYGMNKIAMQQGAVKTELPLMEIASEIQRRIALKCACVDYEGEQLD